MALANEQLKDPFHCGECGYFYFSTETATCIIECPQCGPEAQRQCKLRAAQHRIDALNRKLQESIYE